MRARALVVLLLAARLAHADDADPGEVIEVSGTAPVDPEHASVSADELHTMPGGGNDALRGLSSLPGVARIPFGLGGLALRGAAPHDTAVYLDDIPVPILYHFAGLASFVPVDAVDKVDMQASGAGVEWGGQIGGVVSLESRSPHVTHWGADGELSLLHAGAVATGPGPDRGSWLVGVRRSYVDAVLAAAPIDLALAPSYLDAQLRWESGDRRWMAIAFASQDDLHLLQDPDDPVSVGGASSAGVTAFDYNTQFVRAGLRYRDHGVTIMPWVGRNTMVATDVENDVTKGYTRHDALYGVRTSVTKPVLGGVLHVGGDATATYFDYGITNAPPDSPWTPPGNHITHREGQRMTIDAGAFVEESWLLGGGVFEVRPGLRFDRLDLADSWIADPRLTLVGRVPDATLTATIGRYHESPLVTDLDPIFKRDTLAAPAATQVSVAAEVGPLRVTGYTAMQEHLPVDARNGKIFGSDDAGGLMGIARELVDAQFGSYSYREYSGRGHAYGVEVLARGDLGKTTGWIAYTYARSFRNVYIPSAFNLERPYVLDQPHVFTAVATRPLATHWRIGARFRFASGNPIDELWGADYDQMKHEWKPVWSIIPLTDRLPYFAELDLRVDRTWRHWGFYLDVQNVTNRANAEGVDYSMDYKTRYYTTGLPILPEIGLVYRQ
jgi:hypothetical protein